MYNNILSRNNIKQYKLFLVCNNNIIYSIVYRINNNYLRYFNLVKFFFYYYFSSKAITIF